MKTFREFYKRTTEEQTIDSLVPNAKEAGISDEEVLSTLFDEMIARTEDPKKREELIAYGIQEDIFSGIGNAAGSFVNGIGRIGQAYQQRRAAAAGKPAVTPPPLPQQAQRQRPQGDLTTRLQRAGQAIFSRDPQAHAIWNQMLQQYMKLTQQRAAQAVAGPDGSGGVMI